MDKKVIIAFVLVLLLIGGGVALVLSQKKTNPSPTLGNANVVTQPSETPQPTTAKARSLRELMGLGVAEKCTFETNGTNVTSNGIIYMSDGKVRGDISSQISGQTQETHMIVDGKTSYVWISGQTNGFKMAFENATASGSQTSGINPDNPADYKCLPWSTDASMFVLPTGINFIDASAIVKPVVSKVPAGSSDKCAACSYLTNEQKAQCLKAMGCE